MATPISPAGGEASTAKAAGATKTTATAKRAAKPRKPAAPNSNVRDRITKGDGGPRDHGPIVD